MRYFWKHVLTKPHLILTITSAVYNSIIYTIIYIFLKLKEQKLGEKGLIVFLKSLFLPPWIGRTLMKGITMALHHSDPLLPSLHLLWIWHPCLPLITTFVITMCQPGSPGWAPLLKILNLITYAESICRVREHTHRFQGLGDGHF